MSNLIIQSYGKCVRTGVSKNGNPWAIYEAWDHSDDSPYPRVFEYFSIGDTKPLGIGTFEVPIKKRFVGNKMELEPDFNNARLIANKSALNPAQPKA